MAKINKYWGMVALGAATAAVAGNAGNLKRVEKKRREAGGVLK